MSSTSDPALHVAQIIAATDAEGPGTRTAIWVQGCSLRCAGCFNPHMWSTRGGQPTAASTLVGIAEGAGAEGITLLGGEPFEQAPPAAALAQAAQAAGLSVMVFTGYTLAEIKDLPGTAPVLLLAHTDLLVDGRFDQNRLDTRRPWVGSTNQRFHFLTDRYAHLADQLDTLADRIEVRVDQQGIVSVNGWASTDALDLLLDGVGTRLLQRAAPRREHRPPSGWPPA